jgi:hypothetical protein
MSRGGSRNQSRAPEVILNIDRHTMLKGLHSGCHVAGRGGLKQAFLKARHPASG